MCFVGDLFLFYWGYQYQEDFYEQCPKNSNNCPNCKSKAHVTCDNWDANYHDLCGYQLQYGTFDSYVNEEWFGITEPSQCPDINGKIDSFLV